MADPSPCHLGYLPPFACVDCDDLDDCPRGALPPADETPEEHLRATTPNGRSPCE